MGLIDLTHKGPKFPRPLVAMPNLKDLITSLPDKVRLEVNDRLQEQQSTNLKVVGEWADLVHGRVTTIYGSEPQTRLALYGKLQTPLDSHQQYLLQHKKCRAAPWELLKETPLYFLDDFLAPSLVKLSYFLGTSM